MPHNQRSKVEIVDGTPNWYFHTDIPNNRSKSLTAGRGIWSPSPVKKDGEMTTPVIICTTSPHREGSFEVPWSDVIKTVEGYAIYFGDNKIDKSRGAESVVGNRLALDAWQLQNSPSRNDRLKAPPVILVSSHGEIGKGKGYRRVEGLCVITRADFVLQRDPKSSRPFRNIRFEFLMLDLQDTRDSIPIDWINSRRDSSSELEEDLKLAPLAWQRLVERGASNLESYRRRVFQRLLVPDLRQTPERDSEIESIRNATIGFFDGRKHDFETIGARITERLMQSQGFHYKTAWITPRSSDGGLDFVGSIDLNPTAGFQSSRHVIVGQAKCENALSTGGNDVARLASRLRRGWHGVYVTTSKFSSQVQRELIADKVPIILINGNQVASIIRDELNDSGLPLIDYLNLTVKDFQYTEKNIDPDLALIL